MFYLYAILIGIVMGIAAASTVTAVMLAAATAMSKRHAKPEEPEDGIYW